MEKIKTSLLFNLFNMLLIEVQSHNIQWYLNIQNSTRLIESSLILVKENKVREFDLEVCKNLLSDATQID